MKARIIHSVSSASAASAIANVLQKHWPTATIEVTDIGRQRRMGGVFPASLMVIVNGRWPEEISAEIVAIRQSSDFPLVVYSRDVEEKYEIEWLHLGADEVITTGSAAKFLAIVDALMRRLGDQGEVLDKVRNFGDMTLKSGRQELTIHNKRVQLTPTEFRLLDALTSEPGEVVSPARLAKAVWGVDTDGVRDSLKVHLSHLRRKLADAESTFTIQSMRGTGYALAMRDVFNATDETRISNLTTGS